MRFLFQQLLNQPIVDDTTFPSAALEGTQTNINGPSLIRVPDWIPDSLGRYYLYFAHHEGRYIRLAYADELTGPWKNHAPGALALKDSLFCQTAPLPEQTDANVLASIAAGIDGDYPHIASPDVHIDTEAREIRMYFHGRMSNGTQQTRLAISSDGLTFTVKPAVLGDSYFRVFQHRQCHYAIAWGSRLYRSRDNGLTFQPGPTLTCEAYRHGAILRGSDDEIYVFWTRAGDCPESILVSRLDDSSPSWRDWRLGTEELIHAPAADWEGADLPLEASSYGGIMQSVNQIRDPAIYTEEHRTYLLYSIRGEQGIGIGELETVIT